MEELIRNNHFIEHVKNMFEREEIVVEPTYERTILDNRIDRFLDDRFSEYIREFGIVTREKLTGFEQRMNSFEKRVDNLMDFVQNTDTTIKKLEKRLGKLKTASKSKTQK